MQFVTNIVPKLALIASGAVVASCASSCRVREEYKFDSVQIEFQRTENKITIINGTFRSPKAGFLAVLAFGSEGPVFIDVGGL